MLSTNQPRRSYSDTTAWLVAYGIAIGFCVVSLIANICFAASVAASPVEKAILIATAVLLDLVKATALVLAFRSYMRGHLFFAGVTVAFGLGALAWSSISGLGFIATARSNAAAIHASVQEQQSAWVTTVRQSRRATGDRRLGATGRSHRGRYRGASGSISSLGANQRMRRPKPRQAAWRMRAHIEASSRTGEGACSRRAGGADRRDPQAACHPSDSRCERSASGGAQPHLRGNGASLARCSRHRVGRVGGGRLDAGFCHCA